MSDGKRLKGGREPGWYWVRIEGGPRIPAQFDNVGWDSWWIGDDEFGPSQVSWIGPRIEEPEE